MARASKVPPPTAKPDGKTMPVSQVKYIISKAWGVAVWVPTVDGTGGAYVYAYKKYARDSLGVLPDSARIAARVEQSEYGAIVYLGGVSL
jgi:hypothetical protein